MPALRRHAPAALLFLLLALVVRVPQFGNPVIQVDEQFYLLVGDRMWQGALPYVDLWDRKPIGLFLIYAAIRLLGGDGIIQYQLVATGFAAATAFLIARLSRRIAPPEGGWFAGGLYLVFLMVNGGDGGQAPVFYNLPVAGAALLALRVVERPSFDRAAFVQGCGAMLLLGIAIQIKYTVAFEGAFFGLALLAAAWAMGTAPLRVAGAALAWIAIALAPTGLALASYAALGHADAFIFTNFRSIFLRPPFGPGDLGRRIAKIVSRLAPMTVAALAACWMQRRAASRPWWLLMGWLAAAILSLIGFGTYHDHYALPVLAPLAVAGAPVYAWRWRGLPVAALLVGAVGIYAAVTIVGDARWRRGTGPETWALVKRATLGPGEQLFVFSGDPILYHLSKSPLPTPYNFPTLLSERTDSASLGIDTAAELRRVIATRPRFIVTRDGYPFLEADRPAWDYMNAVLAAEYRPVLSQKVGTRQRLLYERVATPPGSVRR